MTKKRKRNIIASGNSGESNRFIDEETGEIIERSQAGYIVDALFGTGFSRAVEGLYLEIIARRTPPRRPLQRRYSLGR